MEKTYSDFTQKVHAALTRDSRIHLPHSDLHIDTDAQTGRITLSGSVPNVAAKRLAVRLAREIPGVGDVEDRLRVQIASPMGDLEIAEHLRRALIEERNIEEDHIEIETDPDGGVVLRGSVHSLVQYRLCEVLCWWIPGVSAVENQIRIEPADTDNDEELRDNLVVIMEKDFLVNPTKFQILVRDGRVTLRGEVDSPSEIDAAEKDCWYTPGVKDVENRLTLR